MGCTRLYSLQLVRFVSLTEGFNSTRATSSPYNLWFLSSKSVTGIVISSPLKNNKSPVQKPCDGACLDVQIHGYWTGCPYEQAAKQIANTGRLRQQSAFIHERCLRQQTFPFRYIVFSLSLVLIRIELVYLSSCQYNRFSRKPIISLLLINWNIQIYFSLNIFHCNSN